MAKRKHNLLGALIYLTSVVCGIIGRGFFFGLGFWWAFMLLFK